MIKHKHHLIPRHMGGSNDPSNLIELTPEDHAQAHRKLWEQYGRWQDYYAWQGLAGYSKGNKHIKKVLSEAGKRGAYLSNLSWKDPKVREKRLAGIRKQNRKGENNNNAKTYTITTPMGKTIKVKSLKTWTESKGFNHNSFWASTIGRKKSFKGYTARLT